MIYFFTLCVLGFLTSPLLAQNVLPSGPPGGVVSRGGNDGSNNWPSGMPTVRPTPTPIPGGGEGDCDGDHDHDHDHDHNNKKKVKIETNIKIQKFTINVGKIDVDIEKREHKNKQDASGIPIPAISSPDASSSSSSSSADDEGVVSNTLKSLTNVPSSIPGSGPIMGDGHDGNKTNKVTIDTNIKIGDFTINVGKIKVDVNKCKNEHNNKPPHWPGSPLSNDTAIFPDDPVSTEPGSDEVVLGEGDVSTQGLPPIGGVSIRPVIYSFTYKISSEQNGPQQVVTFIIRGANFDISSLLGVNDADLSDGLGSLLEPRVFLGAMPLKVVKFTDSYIEARFEDIDDQKSFKAGSYLVRVKILHVEHKIGILSTNGSSDISTLGGLSLPELGIIGSGLPILPGIHSPITSPFPLISLFNGFQFDVATLTVTFSQADADKIANAVKVI